ncbi:MAG: DUF4346 domain-containing protein [Methanosarcinales archaeon]|jgi:dihydropteroate synthase-like protein|nr:DUF4346 domain-containing protein [Methanosarcinales archaeon]
MKILVVTGRLAEAAVKKAVGDMADVLVLPMAVAALITPQKLISGFTASAFSHRKYDAVLVSGFSKFHFEKAEKELGSPIYLGPKHAADLKDALLSQIFSKTIPSCEFIRDQKRAHAREILEMSEKTAAPIFSIGSVSIGGASRMKILAEIVAAESLTQDELRSQVTQFVFDGADMIDVGFSPDADEKTVSAVFSFVKSISSVPVSVDAADFAQLRSGIAAGADLVLSADSRILNECGRMLSEKKSAAFPVFDRVAFVVIPDLFSEEDRLKTLEQNISVARELGMNKIIADPILSPPGNDFLLSLMDYSSFCRRNPDIPVLFGAGNVTELFDADSVGMNALLAEIANECGASVLFTPHAGDKGKGSVRELRTASEMMVLAGVRGSSPKDLGLNLLILKEKRKRPEFDLNFISERGVFDFLHLRDNELKNQETETAEAGARERPAVFSGSLNPDFTPDIKWGWKSDPLGNFLIGVLPADRLADHLICHCGFHSGSPEIRTLKRIQTPGRRLILAAHQKQIIAGIDSAFMLETILNQNLVSDLSHAGYLGRELQKAEIAVLLGRSYAQDDVF